MPQLPEELHAIILASLPAAALGRAACVCRVWRRLAEAPSLWRHHFEALEVPEWPAEAADCRETYVAWTACTRYPAVREAAWPMASMIGKSRIGRGFMVFEDVDHRSLVMVDDTGRPKARLPPHRGRQAWQVVDDQLLTVAESGIVHVWDSDGTLHSTLGEPLPTRLEDFAADLDQVATITMLTPELCVTERAHGTEVYRAILPDMPTRVFFLDRETLALLVIQPPRLQMWRRDRPEILRCLTLDPMIPWSSSVPLVSPTRMVYLETKRGCPESYLCRLDLVGPDAGRMQRLRGPDEVNDNCCWVGESLLCQRSRTSLAVLDARTGTLRRTHELGGPPESYCVVQSVFRDRVTVRRLGDSTPHVELWRFAAPPADLIGTAARR